MLQKRINVHVDKLPRTVEEQPFHGALHTRKAIANLDGEASVQEDKDEGEGQTHADEEWTIINLAGHTPSLFHEAAAGPSALRALPPGS